MPLTQLPVQQSVPVVHALPVEVQTVVDDKHVFDVGSHFVEQQSEPTEHVAANA